MPHDLPLDRVGILKFVHQYLLELFAAVAGADVFVIAQHVAGQPFEVVKVERGAIRLRLTVGVLYVLDHHVPVWQQFGGTLIAFAGVFADPLDGVSG